MTELRNSVYEDLLTLRDSFSCFPQILLVSKEVNKEATSVLYGENYIDVKIYPDGIYVHGRRTGQHTPALLKRHGSRTELDFTTVVWPEFLRRALFLRVIVPDETKHHPAADISHGRDDSIGNIIYSLCQMLRQGNNLRAIHVVVQPTATSTPEALSAMFHPLGLLHNASTHITDHRNNSLASFHVRPKTLCPRQLSTWPGSYKLIYDCAGARLTLQSRYGRSSFAPTGVNAGSHALRTLASAAMSPADSRADDFPLWMNAVHKSVKQLRIVLEECRAFSSARAPFPTEAEFLAIVYRMLRVEIDLTCHFTKRPSPTE